jgi:hypothetical protein
MFGLGLELELGLGFSLRFYHAAAAAHGSKSPGRKMLTCNQSGIYIEFNEKLFFYEHHEFLMANAVGQHSSVEPILQQFDWTPRRQAASGRSSDTAILHQSAPLLDML